MSDIFISYARSTEAEAVRIATALRALGYAVWRDDELPAHRAYAEVIEDRLRAAKAVVVVWSADAAKSLWVRAEADVARVAGTLTQVSLDGVAPPLPFNQIQFADLSTWSGEESHAGWRKALASIAELVAGGAAPASAANARPLPSPPPAPPLLALPRKPSIAVLPFANQTGDPDQAYFVEGMAEDITAGLTGFSGLFVIASSSTFTYGQGPRDLKAIARELGVRYVLEGGVRRSPTQVRIAVNLVEAIAGKQVWAQHFDAPIADLFDLEDKVIGMVAGAIDASINVAEAERVSAQPTCDMDAYDLSLRASACVRNWNKEGCFQALALLDQAMVRDPDYARPVSLAAFVNAQIVLSAWSDAPGEHRKTCRELCARALLLGPADAENLSWVAGALQTSGDVTEGLRVSERAMAINPRASNTLFFNGWMHAVGGDPMLGLERLETQRRLDPRSPLDPFSLSGMGVALLAMRRFEEAAARFAESFGFKPDFPTNRIGLAASWAHLGKVRDARRLLAGFDVIAPELLHDFEGPELKKLVLDGLRLVVEAG